MPSIAAIADLNRQPSGNTAFADDSLRATPRITAIGTATPTTTLTQKEVLDVFQVNDERIRSVFLNGGIERRSLTLPLLGTALGFSPETQGELLLRHKRVGLEIGKRALADCLERANLKASDVDHLCCVTSTGLLTPGFSALLIKEMGFRVDCSRLDVVGMGCNAGLNALAAVSGWSIRNPGKNALIVCIEVCSAAYVFDHSMRTAVVNSLFGDGAAAIAVVSGTRPGDQRGSEPHIVKSSSRLIPNAIDAMRFDWDDKHAKFSFYLDPDVPYVVGAQMGQALSSLLSDTGVRPSEIQHWIVHAGGKKIVDSVRVNLGLSRHDVRHTLGVLRDHGNLSSGSFLFSYKRLVDDDVAQPGEYGVMMTMGPGSTIELALLHWR